MCKREATSGVLELNMDRDLEALKRLLQATPTHPAGTTERRRVVAERANVNADNLYQVARGIRLKSGRPRSLGRDVLEKLDAAFPGWRNLPPAVATHPAAPLIAAESSPPYPGPGRLVDALTVVAHATAALPAVLRPSVRVQFERLVYHPEMRDDVIMELQELFSMSSGKQHAVGT